MPTTDVKSSETGVRACPCGAALPWFSRSDRRYCSDRCRAWYRPANVRARHGRLERYPRRAPQPKPKRSPVRPRNKGYFVDVLPVAGLTVLDGPDAGLTVWSDGTVEDRREGAA